KVLDPLYYETNHFRSTTIREKQQGRDLRDVRDLLVQMLHLGAVPLEAATLFARDSAKLQLAELRVRFLSTLELHSPLPPVNSNVVTGFQPGQLAEIARVVIARLASMGEAERKG